MRGAGQRAHELGSGMPHPPDKAKLHLHATTPRQVPEDEVQQGPLQVSGQASAVLGGLDGGPLDTVRAPHVKHSERLLLQGAKLPWELLGVGGWRLGDAPFPSQDDVQDGKADQNRDTKGVYVKIRVHSGCVPLLK